MVQVKILDWKVAMIRHGLSAQGMYSLVRDKCSEFPDNRLARGKNISVADAAMSAVAMFGLKYPSMLQFQNDSRRPGVA